MRASFHQCHWQSNCVVETAAYLHPCQGHEGPYVLSSSAHPHDHPVCHMFCSPAEMFGTLDWQDPYGRELHTSGIKAYGRAKLQVRPACLSRPGISERPVRPSSASNAGLAHGRVDAVNTPLRDILLGKSQPWHLLAYIVLPPANCYS